MTKKLWLSAFSISLLLILLLGNHLFAQEQYVFDDYGVFSAEELIEINQKIAEINEKTGIDFAVIFLRGVPADSSSKYYHEKNKEFLKHYDFGQGKEKTAVAMSVDMENRHIQVTAHGKMYKTYKKDKNIQATIKAVGVKLRADDFKGAVHTFVNYSLSAYKETNKNIFLKLADKLFDFFPLLGALFIALCIMAGIALTHNRTSRVGGVSYEKLNSFQLNHRIDQFLYTTTTSRTISDSDNSDSGGYSNDSDSSYSGGGGSF